MGVILFQVIGSSSGICAEKVDEKRWSVAFDGVTVSEALGILSQKTGVKIHATKVLDSRVRKRYQGKTIDQIVKDLLRNTSYSLVWSTSRQGTDSLQIRVFEKGKNVPSPNRPVPPPGRTIVQEKPPRAPLQVRRPPPAEPPVQREPDSPSVEEGGSESTDSAEEPPRNRAEPPKADEAPGSRPEQPPEGAGG